MRPVRPGAQPRLTGSTATSPGSSSAFIPTTGPHTKHASASWVPLPPLPTWVRAQARAVAIVSQEVGASCCTSVLGDCVLSSYRLLLIKSFLLWFWVRLRDGNEFLVWQFMPVCLPLQQVFSGSAHTPSGGHTLGSSNLASLPHYFQVLLLCRH